MARANTKLYGVGTNDAIYNVTKYERSLGKQKIIWKCPYYSTWKNMLNRCYCKASLQRKPNYKNTIVCKEWLSFSKFRTWMKNQQWIQFNANDDIEKLQLDKDFLSGNKRGKVYGPTTCVFISKKLNTFLLDRLASRGQYPLGVNFHHTKYEARCNNPFTNKREYLGSFNTPDMAQAFYVTRKQELAKMLAAEQTDPRIAQALLNINWFD